MRVGRIWRRKGLKRLIPRPEMAPPPGSSTASLRPAVFDPGWKGRMRAARKWRRKGLKRLNPHPDMASGRVGRKLRGLPFGPTANAEPVSRTLQDSAPKILKAFA